MSWRPGLPPGLPPGLLSGLRAPGPAAPRLRIGIYGGSFDPLHGGHVHVAHTALARFGLDHVWALPSPQNPLKPAAASPFSSRLAHARAGLSGPRIHVGDLEARLGARFTVETMAALRARWPRVRFVQVMGADSFAGLHRWRDWRALAEMAPIAVIARPGWTLRAMLAPAAIALPRRAPAALIGAGAPGWAFAAAPLHPASSTALRNGN